MARMEAEVWNLVNHLLTRTASQSATTELEKIRRAYPSSVLMTQNVVGQFASFLRCLDERCQHTLNSRILKDIAVWVEQIWHYSPNCLRVCSADSDEALSTVCRVALQEAWFSDSSPPFQSILAADQDLRPVIYISPGAPPHLRRWLSLNLCCSGLLLVSLPSSHTDELPTIDVSAFTKLVENDVKLGRKPLLLIAYSGGAYYGSSDCLSALSAICRRHKIWLHVEGLSILRFALLTKPPIDHAPQTTINSLNLDFSMCVGICQPVNVVVLRSTLPESILLYLNVFPLSAIAAVSSATSAQDGRAGLDEGTPSMLSIPRTPFSSLPEAILTWISLRLQDGHSEGVGARMRHATELTHYMASELRKLPDIHVLAKSQSSATTTDVSASQPTTSKEDTFVAIMDEFSGRCPVLIFRYSHLSRQKPNEEEKTEASKANSLSLSVSDSSPVTLPARPRCKSDCSFAKQKVSQEARFLNGLNEWLASALQFEHPGMGLKICSVDGNKACIRFSPLSAVSLMSIKEADIDAFVQNVATSCTIMECTLKHRAAFRSLVNSTPGLYYFHLLDWAGLGAAFYVPHTYRCLFPSKTGVSPQPPGERSATPDSGRLVEAEEEDGFEGTNSSHNRAVIAALLRLPPNAAQAIADVNRDLISRLRNHDFAFSSVRVNFPLAAIEEEEAAAGANGLSPTRGSGSAIARVLDPLASSSSTNQSAPRSSVGAGGGGPPPVSGASSPFPAARDSVPPIVTAGLSCLRFGLITPGTDITEMLELVLQVASAVEEDSNYVNNLSEIVKRGIEEATNQLKVEQEKKLREEGMLRQVPYLERLVNWWYPPSDAQIPGRALNLSIGELSSTQPLLRQRSSTISLHHQATSSDEKSEETALGNSNHASTGWQWFPFGRKPHHSTEATAQAISTPLSPKASPLPQNAVSNGGVNGGSELAPGPGPASTPLS
ncbi:Pyridoxal-dependent decarboxylase domain-containing protein 1 [Sparganum proliferum]